jgi:hypothetical protein
LIDIVAPFGCLAKPRFERRSWGDLNKPDVLGGVGLGSRHDVCAHRFTPKAQRKGFNSIEKCVLALRLAAPTRKSSPPRLGLARSARTRP